MGEERARNERLERLVSATILLALLVRWIVFGGAPGVLGLLVVIGVSRGLIVPPVVRRLELPAWSSDEAYLAKLRRWARERSRPST